MHYLEALEKQQNLRNQLEDAAVKILLKLDKITTEEFMAGGEKEERDALRKVLVELGRTEVAL